MKLPPTDTGACGTTKGGWRHYRRGEAFCRPCRTAESARKRRPKKASNGKLSTRPLLTAEEVADEIRFFLRCGEGTHAILKAVGYAESPHVLRARLKRNGYDDLGLALFGEAA